MLTAVRGGAGADPDIEARGIPDPRSWMKNGMTGKEAVKPTRARISPTKMA